jgi:hypothetical protein
MTASAASRMAETVGSSAPSGLSRAASRACATVVGAAAIATATGAGDGEDEPLPGAPDPRVLISAAELVVVDKAGRRGTGFSRKMVAKGRSGSWTTVILYCREQLPTTAMGEFKKAGGRAENEYGLIESDDLGEGGERKVGAQDGEISSCWRHR